MKVLSIKEPFASLICRKKKSIETRSWKTNFRGEIYIHASKSKLTFKVLDRKELMSLVDIQSMKYGYILCKAKLVDCIYMTPEFIEDIKKNNYQEYICGEYKVGRYAWILEDVTPLEVPIKARGNLGFWDYYSEVDVLELMQDITYGWVSKDNKKSDTYEDFASNYVLQTPKELMKNKCGVCFDQTELERYYLKNSGYDLETYFIVYDIYKDCYSHTFLIFAKEGNYYWLEHAWEKYQGLHKYATKKELLKDVYNRFIKEKENIDLSYVSMYKYSRPKFHITCDEFFAHSKNGEKVIFD